MNLTVSVCHHIFNLQCFESVFFCLSLCLSWYFFVPSSPRLRLYLFLVSFSTHSLLSILFVSLTDYFQAMSVFTCESALSQSLGLFACLCAYLFCPQFFCQSRCVSLSLSLSFSTCECLYFNVLFCVSNFERFSLCTLFLVVGKIIFIWFVNHKHSVNCSQDLFYCKTAISWRIYIFHDFFCVQRRRRRRLVNHKPRNRSEYILLWLVQKRNSDRSFCNIGYSRIQFILLCLSWTKLKK